MIKEIDHKIFLAIYYFTVSNKLISNTAIYITKISSKFFSIIYFSVGAWLIHINDPRLRTFILVPAAVYLAVKLIPIFYNRQRPFAEYDVKSLVKQREDHSFPSTHAASSMIISLVFLNINPFLGELMIFIAILTAFSRIMLGVHYPTDIIAAWVMAVIINLVTV